MKKYVRFFLTLLLFTAAAGIILLPSEFAKGVYGALLLSAKKLIPSLFLMMSLSRFAYLSGILNGITEKSALLPKLFHLPKAAAEAYFWGNISGFPVGAKICADLYSDKRLTKNQAESLLAFCNNCSPAFLLSAAVNILGSGKAGLFLFIISFLSANLTGYVICSFLPYSEGERVKTEKRKSLAVCFTEAVAGSFNSCLTLTAFLLFASLFTTALSFLPLPLKLNAFLSGIIELTGGINSFSEITRLDLSLIAFLVSFGGICVLMQTVNVCKGLSAKKYVFGKIISGTISFFAAYIFYPAFFENRFEIYQAVFPLLLVFSAYILRKLNPNIKGENNAYRKSGKQYNAYKKADGEGYRTYGAENKHP